MSFIQILHFLGGLALFLFGMNKMSDNLQAVAGPQMRNILKKLTDTPLKGAIVGMGITALIQSSYATTLMTIGFVNAGIMTLKQAVGVVMGANIGTTITAQLIAFNISQFAYVFVIVGVVLMFLKRSRVMERWSGIALGFGLLFVGLSVMSQSVMPLKDSDTAHNVIAYLSTNPFMGILTGMVFTMMLQSSAASIGIVIVLANSGLIGFESALYLVYGDNIGTTITAWIASLGTNTTSKRVALVHTLFNVFGTIIFGTLTYLGYYTDFINFITPGNVSEGVAVARHIANAHTFFNVFNTMLFLPFASVLVKIAETIIPKGSEEAVAMGEPRYLNYHLVNDSELAIFQAVREMREMLRLVKMGLSISYEAFKDKSYRKQVRVAKIENSIDNLQREVTRYLVTVNERTKEDNIIQKIPALLHTVNDIEKLGDYTEEVNHILNYQMEAQKSPLSPVLIAMIEDLYSKVAFMLDLCIQYLEELKPYYIFKIIEMEGRLNERHHSVRAKILVAIQNGDCDAEAGLNTIDFIDAMELMGDKMENLARAGAQNFVYMGKLKNLNNDEEGT